MRCPCKSRRLYKRCCQPWHRGRPAPSPEALMRSRYSAYALGLVDYIVRTGSSPQEEDGVRAFCENTRFVGLEILESDPAGMVVFRAELEQEGQDVSFTERSRFECRDGHWVYVSGERIG